MLSVGGLSTGLISLLVLPIAWTALYLKRWQSAVVVAASAGALCGISIVEGDPLSSLVRRIVLWWAVGALLSVATHVLRSSLDAAIRRREELLHQAQALGAAARLLNQTQDPGKVVALAAQLAALVGSTPRQGARCAHYLRVHGAQVHYVAQYDERGDVITEPWPLADAPLLARAVRTGRPLSGVIGEDVGPTARAILDRSGITHAAWIPIHVNGELDGILAIAARGGPIPSELFARGIELAQIVELALTNALSLQTQAHLSRTDPVTGLANRRGFEAAFRSRPDETSFTILSMDLDGLKSVNDTYGHSVGDELLVLVATTLAGALRSDDVLARIGGDEFAAVLFDASPSDAETVATRILTTLSEVHLGDVDPRISIGIAVADRDADPDVVGLNADRAMYRAKRLGGMRYEFAA
jgi:diguanylate cyclase (GGDEF)-like protein